VNRRMTSVLGGLAAFALVATVAPGSAQATPPADPAGKKAAVKKDDRPDKLEQQRRELRKEAISKVVSGDAKVEQRGGSKSVRVAPGQWVEYETEATDQLLSFLVEFGGDGPQAGNIPAPDRSKDNSTYWQPQFDREHFMDMFFNGMPEQNGESFKDFYKEQSSGRYDVEGDVSDWVKIPNPESDYGTEETHADMTEFIDDTAEAWYAEQLKTKTKAEVEAYLKTFDEWDRFDFDHDGNFDEPDGYIDHFQAIHAGEGEEAGAPESAIWSHRWAVNQNGYYSKGQTTDGPAGNVNGGIRIGDTDLWIRDYTTEPENGGLGVFAHEYGHDLGLPDFYDTQGGENSTAFWTLMSSGSWMSHGNGAIGTTPDHMGPWEKLQLGWLDYATVEPGESKEIKLGPSYHATKSPQAVLVKLPTGTARLDAGPGAAPQGSKYLYSGEHDDKVTSVTSPEFTVPANGALNAQVNYDTEKSYDYAYTEISVNGGAFKPVHTNVSDVDDPATPKNEYDPNKANEGEGISGTSDGWKPLVADLASFAGQKAKIRFRMVNDENTHGFGFAVDDISVGTALAEDVEGGAPSWTKDEWIVVEGGKLPPVSFQHFYLAENRQYMGYDKTLAEGPYNFGWGATAPDRVEHFPYQNGLLVWYSNGLYSDNNTSQHPGGGEALPVDARAAALKWSDGTVARNRIQAFDATFGLSRTDPISLHRETVDKDGKLTGMTTLDVPSQSAIRTFDDSDPNRYYDAVNNPGGSTRVGGTGTTIGVVNANDKKGQMTIQVN
jgi:immune inhibitor A